MNSFLRKTIALIMVLFIISGVIFASEISDNDKKKVYLMNEYTYYTSLIKLAENRIVLTDVYNHLYYDYSSQKIDKQLSEKLESMMGLITDLQINSMKKERLEIIFDLQKSQAIASAIPNPGAVLGVLATGALGASSIATGVSTGNPMMVKAGTQMVISSAVSTVNIAASSISQYNAAKNANLISFLNDKWELEYDEMRLVNKLNTQMFNLQNSIANEMNLEDRYVIKEKDMQEFVKRVQNGQNVADKIAFLETRSNVYSEFPLYWLELANAYSEFGQYDKCYNTILQYYERFSDYSSIFHEERNVREGQVLVSVVNALLNIYAEHPMDCKEEIIKIVERIEACTRDDDWLQKYFCAMIYIMYSEQIEDSLALRAKKILRQNAIDLAAKQSELNKTYISDLVVTDTNAKQQMTKAQREDLEQTEKEAQEKRKTELPTLNSAFLENLKAYVAIADKSEILADIVLRESSVQQALLLPQLKDAIFNDESLVTEQYGFDASCFSLKWHLILWGATRTLDVKIPAVFLTSGSVMNLGIKLGKDGAFHALESSDGGEAYTFKIKNVERPQKTKDDVNSYIAEIEITIPSDIDIEDDRYSISLFIDTGYCPITLFFSSQEGKYNKISFEYISKNYDGFENSNAFNMLQAL